ncbi:hypothetical protein [Nonomuraea basaltis]|uniref:hypothetical protein n=1 Tax=Nonomuraea basaltis TaxID=2495887 RepID=UPI00110C590F|nr:hypothetical protein [Nonomuraea basaltis]TMR90046.1 hypothetical protein EJK15_57535 [Nonomuraea basaltis]
MPAAGLGQQRMFSRGWSSGQIEPADQDPDGFLLYDSSTATKPAETGVQLRLGRAPPGTGVSALGGAASQHHLELDLLQQWAVGGRLLNVSRSTIYKYVPGLATGRPVIEQPAARAELEASG